MKVLHLLASNKYSGAENVVCQIIKMFNNSVEMVYCSVDGPIAQTLKDKDIKFIGLNSLTYAEVKKAVEEYKPDVIHAHDVRASIMASRFSKSCKIISHIHGNDERKMGKLSLKSILYAFSMKKYSKIFWVSNSCLDKFYFKKKAQLNSEILHNIININDLYKTAEEDNSEYDYDICYLGRLSEIKNPIRALEIMKMVAHKLPNVKCAVVGDGDLRSSCEEYIKENNLENNISLLGFMKNPYKILGSSKALLMSSINEGTPMVLLEAFALGVPLVSTKIDGAVEIIKNDKMGFLYDENSQAVDYIIKTLSTDNGESKDYLKEFSKQYNDIEKYKTKILNAYNK